MKLKEFSEAVDADEELVGLGTGKGNVFPDDKEEIDFGVEHTPSKLKTALTITSILNMDWVALRSIIVGEREPDPLTHMTRVVGYFSGVDNWNKSKLGELKDRQKGDYKV